MRQSLLSPVPLISTLALLGSHLAGCATANPPDETSDTATTEEPGDGAPETSPEIDPPDEPEGSDLPEESSSGGERAGVPATIAQPGKLTLFQAPHPWTKSVEGLPKAPKSDQIIAWLQGAGGWGGGKLRMDFGMHVLEADGSTPMKSFTPTNEFYSPDCDHVPFPVPAGGAIEAESGYACTGDGDCHLLVVHRDQNKLYEMWRANITGGAFKGGCAAVWDLAKAYPDDLRGEGCTSADAGGFPISAMLFTPEEVQSGVIAHALRFILPNSRIRDGVYVHPGTHSTHATKGGANAPPYGVRFRLRKDYPLDNLPAGGPRVIAKAMQTYGMFLSDGGTITVTGASDRFSSVKWSSLGVSSHSLTKLKVTDFEVVDMGAPVSWSGSCSRNP